MASDTEQFVRERAHQIWEAAGRPDGQEHEHWAAAERDVTARAESHPLPGRRSGRTVAARAAVRAPAENAARRPGRSGARDGVEAEAGPAARSRARASRAKATAS